MAQLPLGSVLEGRWQLVRELGTGGMGTVYAARDRLREREVALKVLELSSEERIDAFRREFFWLASAPHPHLARPYDFWRARGGTCFYTAELITGRTLDAFARGSSYPELARAIADALDALAWLHAAKIRHGDFKPANVLVRPDARGVLIDLSAAAPLGESPIRVSGTLGYLAPELVRDGIADARSDLFAVGRTLDELLPLTREVPADAAALVRRLTAPDPTARPSDAREVMALLDPGRAHVAGSPSVEPATLIGRDAELERARDVIAAHSRSRDAPRVICVTGPAGIGKSRLLREIIWRAELELGVVEGSALGGIADLLGRALGTPEPLTGVEAALRARDELAVRAEPLVVAIDDADRLSDADRDLLIALMRVTARHDRILWLVAARDPRLVAGTDACLLELRALDEPSVARWVAPHLTAARVSDVMVASGGVPELLRQLVYQVARGELGESEVARFADSTTFDAARSAKLGDDAARALGVLAIMERVSERDLACFALEPAAMVELEVAGLVRLEAGEYRLRARAPGLLSALPEGAAAAAHATVVAHVTATRAGATPELASELSALELRCHLALGDLERVRVMVSGQRAEIEHAPQAWVRALDAVIAREPRADAWISLALAHEAAGDAPRALTSLARALRTRPAPALRAEIACRAASSYEKLGRLSRAALELTRADREPALGARVAAIRARCALRAGAYQQAVEVAEAALAHAPSVVATELGETLGVALGYLGRQAEALRRLDEAVELGASTGSSRARARTLSYRALFAYRSGDTARAIRGFEEALGLAERHGLGDLLATSALNVGTARHQSGDWGGARDAYERGLRAALAYGRERTALTLRFNLGKLHADVGLHELCESVLAELDRTSEQALGRELAGAVLGLRAEVASARGAFDEARDLLGRARELHERRGSQRELCECGLSAAELALGCNDAAGAALELDRAQRGLCSLDAADLELRAATIQGRIALARGDADGALACVRGATELAARAGQLELHAELDRLASEAYLAKAAPSLAERQRISAIECWERIASSLPASWGDAFWRHPRRRGLRRSTWGEGTDARFVLALRVLEINRRLSSTLETSEILRLAMDAAIELTGAERGFVVLRPTDARSKKLEIAIARNLDRERIGKGHLKLSHGVAKRVLDTGEPVLSVDALEDDRFSANESVHALRLRSIVCVPIRAHGEVIGALYVDNRFQRARFGPEHAEALAAFADQVAVALSNGRLLQTLRQRTLELEQEQGRVAALMRSQADEIERLSHELLRERTRGEPGREYPEIVGQSVAIRRVLALLDKVVDSDVSVLISGESGTGKELVARAIHFGGSRKERAFVAINCAALPEPLLESELFGHVKGAFTGAVRDHDGLFVRARGGTLFLDEIGEMSLGLQAKLLRAVQEREVRAVGSDDVRALGDVRIVAASNRRLRDEISVGRFRHDLYYRLSVVELELPALRERPEDVPLLARAILDRIAEKAGRPALTLTRAALAKLGAYAWPGNVRQLENVLARACVLADGDRIEAKDLELPDLGPPRRQSRTRSEFRDNEADRIRAALEQHHWNVCEVSRALGIPRTSLYRKLHRYGLITAP